MSQTNSPAEILQQLKDFRETGSVLYVAAHPDDENTVLITYLARGLHYRTAYLSLTRGDGGQNVLGPEFGAELGVIRTQELLAARRLDGGQQFFSRAMDFGFSKDYRETLNNWDREQVVSDIVRVIREFRPDVVINRFSTTPGGTHGHHTASAILSVEAFKLAGDPNAFPEQHLPPWQPKRILVNGGAGGRSSTNSTGVIHMDVSGNDPVSGESFSAIAARSRSMHKTQGFGNFGGFGGGGARAESFQVIGGEPATNGILDGVDTTWARFPGGAEIGKQIDEIIAGFDVNNPSASVEALLKVRKNLSAMPGDPVLNVKYSQLDKILQDCLGLVVVTTVPRAEVVAGEELKLHTTVTTQAKFPITWFAWGGPSPDVALKPQKTESRDTTLPTAGLPLTQPYWLRKDATVGMFRVTDSELIGQPENPAAVSVTNEFGIGDQMLSVVTVPVEAGTESGKFEQRRTLKVIAPVSLQFDHGVELFKPGATQMVGGEITAARENVSGDLELNAPDGWKFEPAKIPFHLAQSGQRQKFSFSVFAPSQAATAQITAVAKIGGASFDNQRIEINYNHIPRQLLQPPARLKAVSLDLAIRGHKVGYLPGAGDSVADALTQMGYAVTPLTGADLNTNRLKDFDAVVIGVRAFNVRDDLETNLTALFDFVAAGGNVIEQYNRPGRDLKTDQLAPFSLRISGDRVTDETAPVTFLAPDHPVLNSPNKITSADFDGWIQERGIYYPDQWDEHFTPILACGDPGETPLKGGLLVAKYGKGNFIYTGLVFFRELPAGVPGAYRLFANLVSLGK